MNGIFSQNFHKLCYKSIYELHQTFTNCDVSVTTVTYYSVDLSYVTAVAACKNIVGFQPPACSIGGSGSAMKLHSNNYIPS